MYAALGGGKGGACYRSLSDCFLQLPMIYVTLMKLSPNELHFFRNIDFTYQSYPLGFPLMNHLESNSKFTNHKPEAK